MNDLIDLILDWWDEHKYDTTGECGEYNVYDEPPDFVVRAMELKDPEPTAEEIAEQERQDKYWDFEIREDYRERYWVSKGIPNFKRRVNPYEEGC